MAKCDFFKSQTHYLGHLLSQDGILPLPEKLDTIRTMPPPQNIKRIETIPWPDRLLKEPYKSLGRHPNIWTEIHKTSFSELKNCL